MPKKKDQKETPSQQIPVRPPPKQSGPVETYASEGTASDPGIFVPNERPLEAHSGGLATLFTTGGPFVGQSANIHTTGSVPGYYQVPQQAQPVSVPVPVPVPAYSQAQQQAAFAPPTVVLPLPGTFPPQHPHQQHPVFLPNVQPQPGVAYYNNTTQSNPHFVRPFTPTTPNITYHISINMADYGNGSMPNTGQHFQPPVPDTTYGPIPHVYRPRHDNGVPYAAPNPGSPVAFSSVGPYPYAAPMPHHFCAVSEPQVQGVAAPMEQQVPYFYAPNASAPFNCHLHGPFTRV